MKDILMISLGDWRGVLGIIFMCIAIGSMLYAAYYHLIKYPNGKPKK